VKLIILPACVIFSLAAETAKRQFGKDFFEKYRTVTDRLRLPARLPQKVVRAAGSIAPEFPEICRAAKFISGGADRAKFIFGF
jgi:hypothetical protein